jgi:hypothetical protein
MLVAAAVCPHPPLLVPEATGAGTGTVGGGSAGTGAQAGTGAGDAESGAGEIVRLRAACDAAVADVLASRPDLLVVVGGGPRTADYPAQAAGGLRAYGVPFSVGRGEPVLPLSLTIGRWLLDRADGAGTGRGAVPDILLRAVADDASPARCLGLGASTTAMAERVAMLVLGDGPGRRARAAPGKPDEEADRFDAEVAKALSGADAEALAALDPARARALFAAGRAAWQVLAGAACRGRFDAVLHYAAAPFDVSYYVASWRAR